MSTIARGRLNTRSPVRQRGVALLAALILMLALVVILGNIFYRHQIDVSQATTSLHGDQAFLLALSGENWARELLTDANDDRAVDSFDDDWAQAMPVLPVDGGLLTGCISDLQGRVNLNSFGGYSSQSLKAEMDSDKAGIGKTWLQLLTQLELRAEPVRVASIVDWIDADSEIVNSWGAEQPDYDGLSPPRVVANGVITDSTELAAIMGYEVAEVQRLLPWLSALPTSTPINVNTADERLLLAMGGELGSDFSRLVMEQRPFKTLDQLHSAIAQNEGLEMAVIKSRWPASFVAVNSSYFELYLEVTLGEARIEVKSIMDRQDRTEPVIIARQVTLVPASLPQPESSAVEDLFKESPDDDFDEDGNQIAETDQVQSACLMIGETN